MGKIQGMENLLLFLESVGYPLTEEQINAFLLARKIPHSKPYGNMIVFDSAHIQWWVEMQKKTDSFT